MCKIGDIIVVKNFIEQDNQNIGFHYFIVVSEEKGKILGLDFDIVGTVMSSFKNKDQRNKKIRYKENLEIMESDFDLSRRPKKSGFVKADQLFYFNKKNSNYYVVGQVDGDVLLKMLDRIGYLDEYDKLFINIKNLLLEEKV